MTIDNNKITYYLVEEHNLLQLIENSLRYQALAYGGVGNWEWCGESEKDYLRLYADDFLDKDEPFDWQYEFKDVAQKMLEKNYEEMPHSSSIRSA